MDFFQRQLQHTILNKTNSDYYDSNNNNFSEGLDSYDSPTNDSSKGNGRDAYEFVAFLLWYLFLVLCCVIPTCCAYRRRRLVEARIAQQQASVSRIERQNLFILSSLRHNQHNTERIRELRGTKIAEKLKETTMTVQEQNIVEAPQESCARPCNTVRIVEEPTNKDEETPAPQSLAVEYDIEAPDTHCLQIPIQNNNDDNNDKKPAIHRTVPGGCAICLCPYEKGDEVTWSPKEACQHAFHSACIIPWLAKNEEPKCPCCRQDFCDPVTLEIDATTTNDGGSNGHRPFHFFAPSLAHLMDDGEEDIVIPHFMRTFEAEFLASLELATLESRNNNNRNNNNAGGLVGEGGTLGGSPFEVTGGSQFEVHTAETQENDDNGTGTNNASSNESSTGQEPSTQPNAANEAASSGSSSNEDSPDVPLSQLPEQSA